jgi:hypothetical protein
MRAMIFKSTCPEILGLDWKSESSYNGRYDDLDYRSDLNPPLDPANAAWAHELLVSKGLGQAV